MIGTTSIIAILGPLLAERDQITHDEVWKLLGDPPRTPAARTWLGKAMRRMGWESCRHLGARPGPRPAGYRKVVRT